METMQDFLAHAAGTLGISQDQAGRAAGGLLGMIRDKADGADADALLQSLPGAADLLPAGGGQEAGQGGGLGGMLGAAASLLGGKAGAAAGVLGLLQQSGLDAGQGASFAGLFLEFAKQKAGGDLMARILKQLPDLAGLAGK